MYHAVKTGLTCISRDTSDTHRICVSMEVYEVLEKLKSMTRHPSSNDMKMHTVITVTSWKAL